MNINGRAYQYIVLLLYFLISVLNTILCFCFHAAMKFEWAPQAYRLLNGVFCVYKPGDLPVHKVMEIIRGNLTRGDLSHVHFW